MNKQFKALDVWKEMPEYIQKKQMAYKELIIRFATKEYYEQFAKIINQKLTPKTKSIWFPELNKKMKSGLKYIGNSLQPKYPIYIISKGRAESRLTSKALEQMNINYKIVIEEQEFKQYNKYIDKSKILVLPFSNLGQGSIPARNWVWNHSIRAGAQRHWILDDNMNHFYRLNRNMRVVCNDGTIFKAAEDFIDRYKNVAMAGFHYRFFAEPSSALPPFYLNTRIYSCILLDNNIPHRWRGRYNEDTDLSLRILKDGYCTILFNAFLTGKIATMTMKGGNDERWQR